MILICKIKLANRNTLNYIEIHRNTENRIKNALIPCGSLCPCDLCVIKNNKITPQ